ncbi:methionyl-tRNA formyltransferase [Clostridiaceae bacterium HFYG-1003]|nr:methionyl-tRNA formyltransferase [Clostridiaceae bacterium HFYG-1003]
MKKGLTNNTKRLSLVFMGTPDYAAKSLEELAKVYEIALVITQPDRPRGRGKKFLPTPVRTLAESLGIPVLTPESIRKDPAVLDQLKALSPDVIVVVAYGQLLPKTILELPRLGCINLHASLLPAWRGAAPIQQAILSGDTQSGNTTMRMEEGLDTGAILLTDPVAIGPDMTYGELHDVLMEGGGSLLIRTIHGLADGTVTPVPQPDTGVSYVRKIKKEDAAIDFSRPTREILNLIRGMNPHPLAYAYAGDVMVKILKASAREAHGSEKPGTILAQEKSGILIRTGDGAISVQELQLPGKRPMAVADFLNGNRLEAKEMKRSVSE